MFCCSPDKLSLSHSELDNEDLELRLAHHIQTAGPGAVTSIAAAHNLISQLPDTLALYSRLTRLDLAHNRLTSLPASLGQLSGLTHLLLTSNLLTEADLPKSLGRLSSLRSLNLSGNQLEAIPPQLLELTSLRSLYLGANTITEVRQVRHVLNIYFNYSNNTLWSSVSGPNSAAAASEDPLPGRQPADRGAGRAGPAGLPPVPLPQPQPAAAAAGQVSCDWPPVAVMLSPDWSPDTSLASLSRLRVLHLHHNLLTTLPAGLVTITSLQVQYSTVQYSTVQYSTAQYSTVQ